MSQYEADNGTKFSFNDDFFGSIIISIPGTTVKVPAQDILDLVAYHYVRPRCIAKLEQMKSKDLLT